MLVVNVASMKFEPISSVGPELLTCKLHNPSYRGPHTSREREASSLTRLCT